MQKKLVAAVTVAVVMLPVMGHAAGRRQIENRTERVCAALPVGTGAKNIHVGPNRVHVPGLDGIKACAEFDVKLNGTPTVTPYDNCGTGCFAVRVADIRAYQDMKVELVYREDAKQKSVTVDPDPTDVTRDLEEVCISNHDVDAPDPCVITLTSPSDLQAKGQQQQVALKWTPAGEAYGRSVSTTYEVWRNTTDDLESFEMVAEGLSDTRFVDAGLQRKSNYSYYVVAVDENGNRSGGSNIATATTS